MSLAESPPDLPYPKLPFWDAVSLSYSTYFRHFIDAVRASWLWLIVVAAFTGFASWQQWSWWATAKAHLKPGLPPLPPNSEMAVLMNLANALLLLAGVSIAVAWHRLVILNEQPGFSGSNLATKNLWRYIAMALGLFVILFLPLEAVMFPTFYFLMPAASPPPPALFALIPLAFAVYGAGMAVSLRLTLLLPARAIGNTGQTFKQTWNRTRGNTWRLLWGIVVTTVPPLLIAQIISFAAIGFPLPGKGSENFAEQMTIISTVFTAYYLLIVPIGIGFLSLAYRHFFVEPLELP